MATGKCHQAGCAEATAWDEARDQPRGFCLKHCAARVSEHGAKILTMADYTRDPVTGFLHKKIS